MKYPLSRRRRKKLKSLISYSLFSYSRVEVLTTLTTDVGKILAKLHQVQPCGDINFLTGMRIAHVCILELQENLYFPSVFFKKKNFIF